MLFCHSLQTLHFACFLFCTEHRTLCSQHWPSDSCSLPATLLRRELDIWGEQCWGVFMTLRNHCHLGNYYWSQDSDHYCLGVSAWSEPGSTGAWLSLTLICWLQTGSRERCPCKGGVQLGLFQVSCLWPRPCSPHQGNCLQDKRIRESTHQLPWT